MSTYQRRFVGVEQLPRHLSEFDVEQFFRLLPADIIAIRDGVHLFSVQKRAVGEQALAWRRSAK